MGTDLPKIKILYDNTAVRKNVKPAWGFAALVEYRGRTILFDTGAKADLLLANLKALRVSPEAVTDIFISHNHWDHTGGLFGFLSKNPKVKVWLPASFSSVYQNELAASGAKSVRLKGPARIAAGIYSGGELGKEIKEQALVLETSQGLILLTGCSHPGIIGIVKKAKADFKKDVFLVIGGFHLYALSDKMVRRIIGQLKASGVRKVAPCHCTGKKAGSLFARELKKDFIKIGAGSIIDTGKLTCHAKFKA